MKHAIFLTLFFVVTCFVCSVWTQSATNVGNEGGSNCTPMNCQAVCNPGCTTNTTCVLGTMKVCGVCPSSLCIDNSLLGLPMTSGDTNGDQNGDNGTTRAANNGDNLGMIGGMIGGLIGGGLLLVIVGLIFMFRHKKRNSNKDSSSQHVPPISQQNHTVSVSSMSNARLPASPMNLPTLTGPILPVSQQQENHTGLAPLHEKHVPTPLSARKKMKAAPLATCQANDDSEMHDDDDDHSSVSSVSHHGLASMVTIGGQLQQGFPGARLKPQIMRLSTVRASLVNASLNHNRTTSVRTMLTPTTLPSPKSVQCFTNNHNSTSNNNNNSISSTVSSPFSTIGTPSSGPSLEIETKPTFPDPSLKTSTITITESNNNPFDDQHCVIDQ